METAKTLDQLVVGQRATVSGLHAPDSRRLMELGFVPGAAVVSLQEAPWGDPVAYSICGAVIALRRVDARQITIL